MFIGIIHSNHLFLFQGHSPVDPNVSVLEIKFTERFFQFLGVCRQFRDTYL